MAEVGIIVEGLDPIVKGMESEAPKKAIVDNFTDLVLRIEGRAKEHTVWKTGQLRSSITNKITGDTGIIGTNVDYASFVEYGHLYTNQKTGGGFVPPRHMEGSTKVLGVGMFTYTVDHVQDLVDNYEKKVQEQVEKESLGQ